MRILAKGFASLAALGLAACGAQPTDQAAIEEGLAAPADVSAAAEMADAEIKGIAAEAAAVEEPTAEEEADEEPAPE